MHASVIGNLELLDGGEDCLSLLVTASVSRRNDDIGCDEQVFLLDAVSEWKDVSMAPIAEKDNFLSFVLICSVDDEESEDSADTLSNLLFGFNRWILPGLDKKDFQIGFFTGEHKESTKIVFFFNEFFREDVTLENDLSSNVGSCELIFPKVNSRNVTLNNSSSSVGWGFKKSSNKQCFHSVFKSMKLNTRDQIRIVFLN